MSEYVATITAKGQITVPVAIRRHLGVEAADKLAFVIEADGKVRLRPIEYTLRSIRGIVPPLPNTAPDDFEDQIEAAAEENAARLVERMRRP